MSRHPSTKWAQRSDKVYITVELPDAKDVKLSLQPEGYFHFSATAGADNMLYELDFEIYDAVNVDESKAAIGLRNICYLVKKAEKKWWPRLLKKEGKQPVFLKVDWDKWIDEEDEKGSRLGDDMDFGDMDFSKLGMGGADDDFDDEEAGEKEGDENEMEEEKVELPAAKFEEVPAAKSEEVPAAATSEPEGKA